MNTILTQSVVTNPTFNISVIVTVGIDAEGDFILVTANSITKKDIKRKGYGKDLDTALRHMGAEIYTIYRTKYKSNLTG